MGFYQLIYKRSSDDSLKFYATRERERNREGSLIKFKKLYLLPSGAKYLMRMLRNIYILVLQYRINSN